MLTLPAAFAQFQNDDRADAHFIVVIDLGSTWWGFSDCDMGPITDGANTRFIHGILMQAPEISQQIDWNARTATVSDMEIVLDNTATIQDKHISDLLINIEAATISIYLAKGSRITALTDCLRVFKGKVMAAPTYDATECRIEVENFARFAYPMYPRLLESVTTLGTHGEKNKVIPYIVGSNGFSAVDENALGYWYLQMKDRHRAARKAQRIYYACTGEGATIRSVWLKSKDIDAWIYLPSDCYTVKNSGEYPGYTVIELDETAMACYVVARPSGSDENQTYPYPQYVNCNSGIVQRFIDAPNVSDGDHGSYGTLRWHANTPSGGEYYIGAAIAFSFSDIRTTDVDNAAGAWRSRITDSALKLFWVISRGGSYGYVYQLDPTHACEVGIDHRNTYDPPQMRGIFRSDNLIFDGNVQGMNISDTNANYGWKAMVGFALGQGQVRVWVRANTGLQANTNAGESALLIKDLQLHIPISLTWEEFQDQPVLYFTGVGIRDEAGSAIKWLLENVLGLTSGDIDSDSFDNIDYDSDTVPTIKLSGGMDDEEQLRLDEMIDELASNGQCIFVYDFAGRARLVPISPTVPGSADITFDYEALFELPTVAKTRLDELTNGIQYSYNYWRGTGEESRNYTDEYYDEQATSKASHGLQSGSASMRFVAEATIENTRLRQKIANLFAEPHKIVTVRVTGTRAVHLEQGDWFSIDSGVDQFMLYFNGSWSGHKFLVDAKTVTDEYVELRGIEFTKTYGSV